MVLVVRYCGRRPKGLRMIKSHICSTERYRPNGLQVEFIRLFLKNDHEEENRIIRYCTPLGVHRSVARG